jgi:hypothetical protein
MCRIIVNQFRFAYFLVVVLLSPFSASHAEWIRAKPNGAGNDIWINTESNALYSGVNCRPLMKLKHLSGKKPRNLRQRQKARVKGFGNQANSGNSNSAQIGIDSQRVGAGVSLDPLNLSYQTQPEFDPLNRNQFNISIKDNDIALTSRHSRIKARIYGRYDHRPECGF